MKNFQIRKALEVSSVWCKKELYDFIMPWRLRAQSANQVDRQDMVDLLRATADHLESTIPRRERVRETV